jgi:hypothetical protein
MLMVVENHNATRVHRLRIAKAHLASAIVHINNHAQGRMPIRDDAMSGVDTLRLIVQALADIIAALDDVCVDSASHTDASQFPTSTSVPH